MVQFYCFDKCTTCKKAEKYLKDHDVPYEKVDIKSFKFNHEEVKDWHLKSNKEITKLFNTSGILYRELGLKDKIKTLNEDQIYELLASDGMLIKRPILIGSNQVLFGFKENEYEEVVKDASRSK